MIKVSAVIPVYNVEKYLAQCLESIINQRLKEIEIICVNDGSTDSSLKILEEYAQKDNRIKIITKENGGLSSARNAGMKYVTGKYISFIDSDDWVETDMFEKMWNNAEQLDSDFVFCAVNEYDEQNNRFIRSYPPYTLEYLPKSLDNKAFNNKKVPDTVYFDTACVAWNKLYRSSFLIENNFYFDEGLIFEDTAFFAKIYLKAQRISFLRDYLYNYRINRTGAITNKGGRKFFDVITVMNMVDEVFKQYNEWENYKSHLLKRKIEVLIIRLGELEEDLKAEFLDELKKNYANLDFEDYNEQILKSSWAYKRFKLALKYDYAQYKFYLETIKIILKIISFFIPVRRWRSKILKII